MKRVLTWLGAGVLLVLLGVGLLLGVAWWHSERSLARVYAIADPPLAVPTDAVAREHGRHLWQTRGCGECHGPDGQGQLVFDAGPVVRVVAPNVTPAALAGRYDADAIAAAVRHGVRQDGTPLVFMPAEDFTNLSDADMGAIVAYMRALPDSSHDPGRTEVRLLGRILHLFGQFPLVPAELVDHAPRARTAPPVAADAEYGRYLAQICTGCHLPDFRGGRQMGPDWPATANLTPHPGALGGWSEADFVRALREGRRPDGRMLSPAMPIGITRGMTDTELRALWSYLRTLPPLPGAG